MVHKTFLIMELQSLLTDFVLWARFNFELSMSAKHNTANWPIINVLTLLGGQ